MTCGHPPPLVVAMDGTPRFLPQSGGGPLGTGAAQQVAADALDPGAVVVLYSDGLVERPGEALSVGLDRLARVVGDAVAGRVMPAGASASVVERACQLSVELLVRTGYDDDVAMLACQRRAVPIEGVRWRRPAEPAELGGLRGRLRAWLTGADADPGAVQNLEIAVTELIANAIEHAYPPRDPGWPAVSGEDTRPVEVSANLDADGVVSIVVADQGRWQPPAAPAPTSGRGLWVAESVVDGLEIVPGDAGTGRRVPGDGTGTVVTIRYRLHRPALLGAEPTITQARGASMDFAAHLDEGPSRRLTVSGPVDIASADQFAERLATASRGGLHPLIVDLTGVEILASAGVRVLMEFRDRLATHHHSLDLISSPASPAAQVLDLVGLHYRPARGEA